jgi:hypothetical protein
VCVAEPFSAKVFWKFVGESVGGMGRSVTQDVLWVSSTHKPKVFLARPAVDTE